MKFEELLSSLIVEEIATKAIFTFGRFNPPTIGHSLLFDKIIELGKKENRKVFVFLSYTQDTKRNPLAWHQKNEIIKNSYPHLNIVDDPNVRNIFSAGYYLRDLGFKDVTLVVGKDRVKEFRTQFAPYIRNKNRDKSLEFNKFTVVSAGERDPDSDDSAVKASASKARELAFDGEFNDFLKIFMSKKLAEKYFDVIKNILTQRKPWKNKE